MSPDWTDAPPLVVVGDSLLDVDVDGSCTRMCPDEPAPVVDASRRIDRPGGAGLAALLAARDRPVVLVTAIGADEAGERLRELLDGRVTVVDLGAAHTVVKTRVRVDGRTLVRIDESDAGDTGVHGVPDDVAAWLRSAAGVLVSDYGLGVTCEPGIRRLLAAGPTVWDPHPRGAQPVPGVTLVTPNVQEASYFSGLTGSGLAAAIRQGTDLVERWSASGVAVTRGRDGVVLCAPDSPPLVVPAERIHAGDTCGAGDAFAAGTALALATGADAAQALSAGVRRAGDFLGRGAVAGLDAPEFHAPTPIGADQVVARTRAGGGTVVMTGGCFDLLHAGHVAYLEAARSLGDCLVVALNSDDSVRELKGPGRPLVPAADRSRVLSALACVDAVEVFETNTPVPVLERLQPDIFAKGGDYRGHSIPEAAAVQAYGGQVVVLPELIGRSSTRLVHAARGADHAVEEQACRTQSA